MSGLYFSFRKAVKFTVLYEITGNVWFCVYFICNCLVQKCRSGVWHEKLTERGKECVPYIWQGKKTFFSLLIRQKEKKND
jgi:hypothetical protein